MEPDIKQRENIIKKWGLGSILALGAFLVVLTVRIEKIPVIERRVENKIEILDDHDDRLYHLEIEHLKDQIEFEKEKAAMVKELHKIELEVRENKVRLEYLNKEK